MPLPTLKPYPTYKPSGVPGLDDVPAHWEVGRLKAHLLLNDSGVWGENFDEQGTIVLRSTEQTIDGGWRISNPAKIRLSQEERDSALLEANDLLVTKSSGSSAHIGKTTIVTSSIAAMNCCFSNFIQRIRLNAQVNPLLIWHILNSKVGREQLAIKATTTTGLGNLNGKIIGDCYLPLPPLPEQAAIVRYLDYVDRRIRRYVSAKRKLIALLEEEKQAVISQAVTRGLDPNVRLKPSGVEWLGDVPEHWEVRRLKQISVIQTGITLGKDYGDAELVRRPYLRVANVQSGRLDLSEVTTVGVPPSEIKRATLKTGDVLMTEGGDIDKLGRGCTWLGDIPGCLHQNHIFAVRPCLEVLNPALLVALMGSFHGRNYFQVTAKKTTNLATTNRTTLGNFPLYMPNLIEQQTILDYIAEQCGAQDAAIDRARRQIELLQEYRTRLIADVVTGKLDVRGAAAQLPDEGDDREPIDDDPLADDGAGGFDAAGDAVEEMAMESEVMA